MKKKKRKRVMRRKADIFPEKLSTLEVLLVGLRVRKRFLKELPRELFWGRVWTWVPPAPAYSGKLPRSVRRQGAGVFGIPRDTLTLYPEGDGYVIVATWYAGRGTVSLVYGTSEGGILSMPDACCFCSSRMQYAIEGVHIVHDTSKGDDSSAIFAVCTACYSHPQNKEYGLVPQ